ncbi:MAG: phosphoribosylanthranilate isomerase [Ilumatobacteraceae bacterium]
MFVKICGITSEEDALLAVAMGADALGFIFAPSPRQVSPAKVREIVRRLPPEILTIGVFRDEHPSRVIEIVNSSRLHGAQLHGHETPAMAREIIEKTRFVIKAVVAGSVDARRADEFHTDVVLVDGIQPGSGDLIDWSLLSEIPDSVRVMLSGGLTSENVIAGIQLVHPWGVDVCSGVEREPGHKDPIKLREFIAAVRAADQTKSEDEWNPIDQPYDWMDDN